jgi:hypothetical protein
LESSVPKPIVLAKKEKTDDKARGNIGNQFLEEGCWGTVEVFEAALQMAKRFEPLPERVDLIAGVIKAQENTIELLKKWELCIRESSMQTVSPLSLFAQSSLSHRQDPVTHFALP